MAKPNPKKPRAKRRDLKAAGEIELHPDAWNRFERAIGKVAPPKKPKVKRK